MDIERFWKAVLSQDGAAMRAFFHPDAWVNWYNTNEQFTVEEFIRANCEYPGEWDGDIEKTLQADEHTITATHVYSKDRRLSFHVVSFIRIRDGRIASIDEYWGDDGAPPQWRQELRLGRGIR